MANPILQPMLVLIGWTLIVWTWMYATRIPAMQAAKIDTMNLVGGVGSNLDQVLPDRVQWKAHNYNHLLAEPTLFYALCLLLAVIGQGHDLNLAIAWIYVGLRIAHSLVQVTVNRVIVRFSLFVLSTICLMALTVSAGVAVF